MTWWQDLIKLAVALFRRWLSKKDANAPALRREKIEKAVVTGDADSVNSILNEQLQDNATSSSNKRG